MVFLIAGAFTVLYLLLWPFSLRVDARISLTSGRAELMAASFFRLRMEGDFLQPPFFSVYRLDRQGRRKPLGGKRKPKAGGFSPVIRYGRLSAVIHVGTETDGALTVEALGILYALLEAFGIRYGVATALRPDACFDKNICALRLSGIGRFVLGAEYL